MILLVILSLLFSTIVNGQIILDEPVQYPSNLHELYYLVENDPNWQFEPCEVSGSRIHWDSAIQLFSETEEEFEDEAFLVLTSLWFEREIDMCGDIIFGPGMNVFYTWYAHPEEGLPSVVGEFLGNVAKIAKIFISP